MSTAYTIGQSNQLMDTLENAGFTPDDVTKLQQFRDLAKFKLVLDGKHVIVPVGSVKHIINCDADPFIPEDWKVEEHVKDGQLLWNPADVDLYLDGGQKNGQRIIGTKLRNRLARKRVYNANVLDYLLANLELIPEEWKGKWIFFWGTIYRNSFGCLCVRCLGWGGVRWHWYYRWLDNGFCGSGPAALRK